jgi:S1-C subfamily serine protease
MISQESRVRRGSELAAALLLAAMAMLAAGCAGSPRTSARSELLRSVLPSTVQLLAERPGGGRRAASGVVLASDPVRGCTWVLTAGHFVAPPVPETIYIRTTGARERFRATVVRANAESDLALLFVPGLVLPPARRRELAHLGDDVWVVAFPRGRQMTVASGTVSQVGTGSETDATEGPVRLIDTSVSYGASGAGVFDAETGELIGVVEGYRTAQIAARDAPDRVMEIPVPGETLVISAEMIRRFLAGSELEALEPR